MADQILQDKRQGPSGAVFESEGEEYELTPEMQTEVDEFEDNATILIHSEETRDMILQQLGSDPNKVQAVADTSYNVFRKIEASREDSGAQLNEFTMVTGSQFIVNEIIDIGIAAGVFEFEERDRFDAHSEAVKKYVHMGIKQGRITEQGVIELQKQLEPMMQQYTPELYKQGMQVANEAGLPTNGEQPQSNGGPVNG